MKLLVVMNKNSNSRDPGDGDGDSSLGYGSSLHHRGGWDSTHMPITGGRSPDKYLLVGDVYSS